jgi:hypothetical protein
LPEVVPFRRRGGWVNFFQQYVRQEFFPTPGDETFAETGLTISVSDEIKFALIGIYCKDAILSGTDYPVWRESVARRFRIWGAELRKILPRVYTDPWKEFDEAELARKMSKDVSKMRREYNLTVRETGELGETWFVGAHRLSGAGEAHIERDFVFPKVFIECEGGEQAIRNYVMLMNRRTFVMCDILSQLPSLAWNRTYYGYDQFKVEREQVIDADLSYDYTDAGLARMIRNGELARYVRGARQNEDQEWSVESVREEFAPVVMYRFRRCRYKLCTVDEYNAKYDTIGPAKAAVVIFEPVEEAVAEEVSCALLNRRCDHWFANSGYLAHCENPWHMEEDRVDRRHKGLFERATELSREVNLRYSAERKKWAEKDMERSVLEEDNDNEIRPEPEDTVSQPFREACAKTEGLDLEKSEEVFHEWVKTVKFDFSKGMKVVHDSGERGYLGLESLNAVLDNCGILPEGLNRDRARCKLFEGTHIFGTEFPSYAIQDKVTPRDLAFHFALMRGLCEAGRSLPEEERPYAVASALYIMQYLRVGTYWARKLGRTELADHIERRSRQLDEEYGITDAFERYGEEYIARLGEKGKDADIAKWYGRNFNDHFNTHRGLSPYESYAAWKSNPAIGEVLSRIPEDAEIPMEDCRFLSNFCRKYIAEGVRGSTGVMKYWMGDESNWTYKTVSDADSILLNAFYLDALKRGKFEAADDERMRYFRSRMFGLEYLRNFWVIVFSPREIRESVIAHAFKVEAERPDIEEVDGKYRQKHPGAQEWFCWYGRE